MHSSNSCPRSVLGGHGVLGSNSAVTESGGWLILTKKRSCKPPSKLKIWRRAAQRKLGDEKSDPIKANISHFGDSGRQALNMRHRCSEELNKGGDRRLHTSPREARTRS